MTTTPNEAVAPVQSTEKVEAPKPDTTSPAKPVAKKAPAKKAPAKKAPAKPVAKKATPDPKPSSEAAVRVKASTDANHQQWQALKRELTSVMSDLLYDSRRMVPDHSPNQAQATAKVTSALKVLSEFTENVRIK